MSKLFPWSLCRVVWVCLWEDCCWAWMQGVSPPVSHGLSLFGLLCSCSVTCWTSGFPHAYFFPHIGSLSKSCNWPIQSFQWVKRFDLSSQGYWLRDCRMTSGRKIFVWQCLLWSHPSNHQSLFRGKVQNSNLVSPLLGTSWRRERVSGRCCFWVCYAARILHGGVIIETKQLLLTGLTVFIAFAHLWELSRTSRVFVWKLYIVVCSAMREGKMATMPEVLLKYKKMKQAI